MATVEFRGVSKEYAGGICALANFSLAVRDGELLVILGPSGCGKTTALRVAAGLETVSSGDVFIGGARVNEVPPHRRDVALVFQNYALYGHMTVRRNLEFPLRMRKVSRSRMTERVNGAAERLGIVELLDRRPGELSGGEQQRVAMGRALVREPAVFLLDEPLSSLDAATRAQLRAEIAELQRQTGVTTIYVTHDQSEAMTLGTRIGVMEAGRLQQIGTPSEVYKRPANVFVAGFVGGPRMNFISTLLKKSGDGRFQISVGEACVALETDRFRDPSRVVELLGRRVLVGIRPEGVAIIDSSGGGPSANTVKVRSVESLGADRLVHFEPPSGVDLRGSENSSRMALPYMVARSSSRHAVSPGDRIEIEIDSQKVHVFDESGRAV